MGVFDDLQYGLSIGVQKGVSHFINGKGSIKIKGAFEPKTPIDFVLRIAKFRLSSKIATEFEKLFDLERDKVLQLRAKKTMLPIEVERKKIYSANDKNDKNAYNPSGVVFKYRGKTYNEGLLMWVSKEGGEPTSHKVIPYYDKATNQIGNTIVTAPSDFVHFDLSALINVKGGNNVILTQVQGRDYSRKEFVSGGDVSFDVSGNIMSNYPDVYPYDAVSKFIELMNHKGVIQVYNLMFQQLNVSQVVIQSFSLNQTEGTKNVQPYSFTCVAVEPDIEVTHKDDTLNAQNIKIPKYDDSKMGWSESIARQIIKKMAAKAINAGKSALEGQVDKLHDNIANKI